MTVAIPDADAAAAMATRLAAVPDPSGLLQAIFACAPVGLQIYSRDGRCVLVNPAHTELFGSVPPADYNIFHDTILVERGVAELVRRAFAGERITIPPIWYDSRDLRNVAVTEGKRIAVGAELVPLRGSSDAVDYMLFVFHDVTSAHEAREQAEQAAVAAEAARMAAETAAARSEFLAEAGRVLSMSLDYEQTLAQVARLATPTLADFCLVDLVQPDGSMRRVAASHADPQAQSLLDELCRRYPPREGSPQPASRAATGRRTELLVEVDRAAIEAHTIDAAHADLIQQLGLKSHLAVPLQLGDRTLGSISLGYVGSRRYQLADVPLVEALASRAAVAIENAMLYRDVEAARAQAVSASRSKDEFLAMLGHELRNPLAPIVTALDLTRAREGQTRERAIIERQVEHLRRLVDDLLDVSRITRGTVELQRAPLELALAVDEGIELARPIIDQRKHRVSIDVPATGLVIDADRVRIAQIVANVLTNAARYTDPGGEIAITARRVGDKIELTVRDNGIGIAAELMPHVFDLFVQGSRSIDRRGGGLGLGLAIVKALVEQHGGIVEARSNIPGGTIVTLLLPASPVASPAAAQAVTSSRPGVAPQRILVVDDNVDAADLLVDALQLRGHHVVAVYHPMAALELVRTQTFDIGFIDVGLPEIDGFELAKRLRAVSKMQLVAVTGYGQPSDREQSEQAGFWSHLVKPVSLDGLFRLIGELVAVR